MNRKRLFLSPPHMSDEGYELQFVKDAFESNWIAPIGPHVDAFEREFADYIGISHAAALSSGTAALHLALLLLGVKEDDEVLCSSFTFSATANAITYQRAHPVFIDSDDSSWNMDTDLLVEELRRCAKRGILPKAVIVVDLYGQSADYDAILESCQEYNVPVIEDAAEALGATYRGMKCGDFGIAGILSFNGNKIITSSGGGMLVSEDRKLIEKARFLSTQARDQAPHYQHSEIGYNYRMSNVVAAIGRGQLKILDKRVEQKRQIFDYYKRVLNELPGIEFMPEAEYGRCTRWLTCITVDPKEFGGTREDIRLKLEENNIESRPLWKPMHMQPVFEGCRIVGGSVSERLFETGLCLPSGTAMSEGDLSLICSLIRSVRKYANRR
ncbi:MAG: aminotransferase class I/II-fold pyridoxal phosphate-dependent enzyme [Candidatus Hatepunaea meridiana]|nr:aminotransferase class I/II-fold pyridoxal phosphate-dependent enzyme [Candidatus Hatepunaea meridiana]